MKSIQNAVIESTMLGREDHGIMTAYVFLKCEIGSAGFGGYALDGYDEASKERIGVAFGIAFIMNVLDIVEVDKWEKLPGKPCRVDTEGWGGRILRIGHFMKDKWFDPAQLGETMRKKEEVAK